LQPSRLLRGSVLRHAAMLQAGTPDGPGH